MNKKGDLSINIIIMIAIGLLILVILAVMIGRGGSQLNTSANPECASKGGICKPSTECTTGTADGVNCGDGLICCKTV